MSIDTNARAWIPDNDLKDLPVTIRITMRWEAWKNIHKTISSSAPYDLGELRNALDDVLGQLDKVYTYYESDNEDS